MPKLSVVVPIYNVERYLRRCLDSLVNQTLQDIEIILVDDGSQDNCSTICDEYAKKDRRIHVIHKKNDGVSAARNDGLAIATGDYVIFCDSDDWMELDGLEVLYNTAIKENVDVAVADINRIKGNEVIYNRYFRHEFVSRSREFMDELVMADIFQSYCPDPPSTPTIGYGGPWNKAVKRELLVERGISFDTNLLGLYDDILYTAYVYANMGSIAYVHRPVYNYVAVSTSITKTYKANSLDISNRVFRAFKELMNGYAPDGKWDKAYHALVIRRFEECLRLYFFSGKNNKKFGEILKEMKVIMRSEPYVSAAKKVETEKLLPHQRKVAKLMRMNLASGLWILYKLKAKMGKV